MITRIVIEHFKSLERLDLRLGPVTVLVGANGSGKSNVVDALRFLRDAVRHGLDRAVSDRHGIDSIRQWTPHGARHVKMDVDVKEALSVGSYYFTLGSSKGMYVIKSEKANFCLGMDKSDENIIINNTIKSTSKTSQFERIDGDLVVVMNDNGVRPLHLRQSDELALHQTSSEIFRFLGGVLSNFEAYSIFPNTLRAPQPPSSDSRLKPDGANLFSILKRMSQNARGMEARAEILDGLRRLMPNLDSIAVQGRSGFVFPTFRVEDDGKKHDFNALQMSDGTLRMLGLLTALYQPDAPAVIALEEPEQTVHPGALSLLAEAVKEVSGRSQVILTTHSPDLIDRFDPDSIFAVEMVDGVTRVGPVDATQKEAVRQRLFTMGELMTMEGLARE